MGLLRLIRHGQHGYTLILGEDFLEEISDDCRAGLGACFHIVPIEAPESAGMTIETQRRMQLLGMPAQAQSRIARMHVPGGGFGAKWQSFTLEVFGMVLWPPPTPDVAATRGSLHGSRHTPAWSSYSFPYWEVEFREDDAVICTLVIQVWQRILHQSGSPLTLEGRWSPSRQEEQLSIHHLEQIPVGALRGQISALLVGAPFFQRVVQAGRPTGTGRWPSTDAFLNDVSDVVHELRRQGKAVRQETVISQLNTRSDPDAPTLDIRVFQRWRSRAGFASFAALVKHIAALREHSN